MKVTRILRGRYEVLHVVPGRIAYRGRTIDLSRIGEEEAKSLVEQGFPYLRQRERPEPRRGPDGRFKRAIVVNE